MYLLFSKVCVTQHNNSATTATTHLINLCDVIINGDLLSEKNICDRIWENSPLRAQYDFSVEAFIVYLT